MTYEKNPIDIVKALNELDFICIDVDKNDTYIYKMLNDIILLLEKVKKVEELLRLYQRFVNEFEFQIITENNSNDYENWVEEYLDQSGATDNSIILLRKIKALEEELK